MSSAQEVLGVLTAAASPDQTARQNGYQQLQHLKQTSGHALLSACTELFVSPQCPPVARQLAGLQLKNAIPDAMNHITGASSPTTAAASASSTPAFGAAAAQFLQSNAQLQEAICSQALQDGTRAVRNTAASIVSGAVYANLWAADQTLQFLLEGVINRQAAAAAASSPPAPAAVGAVQGGMRALSQIVYDCMLLLESQGLMAAVVQGVLPFLTSHHLFTPEFQQPMGQASTAAREANRDAIEVRNAALEVVTSVLDRCTTDDGAPSFHAVQPMVPQLMEALLANLQGLSVNRFLYLDFGTKACQGLVSLLVYHDGISNDMFVPVLHRMYEVTASCADVAAEVAAFKAAGVYVSENDREGLGIAATGFWSTILNVPRFVELLEPALGSLIQLLVQQMKYSDFEMGMLCANSNDYNVPDKIDDVKPRHYEAKTHSHGGKGGSGADGEDANKANGNGNDDDDDDDDDDDVKEWNLRRVSASTLDDLAEFFGERVVVPVLGCIEGMMQPGQPWKDLEAAVLAFGAICDGCFDALQPYLPTVAARFVQILESDASHFLVLNITMWSCTQMLRYFIETEEGRRGFQHVMRLVLSKMQAPSKLTQESASEALETIVQGCGEAGDDAIALLAPLAQEVLQTISTCLPAYQLKNKVLLFEVLQSVCEVMGEMFQANDGAAEMILGPLGGMWAEIPNDNPLIFSYFSCMATVCRALGTTMQPMAQSIFDRAFGMMSYHVQLRAGAYQKLAGQQGQQGAHQGKRSILVFDEVPEDDYLVTAADLLSGLFDALGSSLEPLVKAQEPTFTQVILFMLTDEESYSVRQGGFAIVGDLAKSSPGLVQASLQPILEATMRNLGEAHQQGAEVGEGLYPVLSHVAWFLCNMMENQLEVNNLPTLSNISPDAVPQLFRGLAGVLCSSHKLPKEATNMAENIVLCLGMMLANEPDLEARSQVPLSAFARQFLLYVMNISDAPQRTACLQGFLLCVQQSPTGPQTVAEHLTRFFDLAVNMRRDSPDLVRALKQILQGVKQSNPQVWAQKMGSYGAGMKTQLFQVYGLN